MNVVSGLVGREYGFKSKLTFDHSLDRLQNYPLELVSVTDDPFFCLDLNQTNLAVASEKGLVRIIKTSSHSFDMKVDHLWNAHNNAISDIKWRPGYPTQLMTVSSDVSFSLWDTNHTKGPDKRPVLTHPTAHLASIKSLSFMDSNVFATGGRDGTIHVWDARLSASASCVQSILDAHPAPPTAPFKRPSKRVDKNIIARSSPLSSVTCVLFQPGSYNVFSTGTSDYVIKLWDIRRPKTSKKTPKVKIPHVSPLMVYSCSSPKSFTSGHGFSSLVLDNKSRIYASCSDHRVYSYESVSGKLAGILCSNSYRTNSFTRIAVVNDYLVSGSVEGSAPVWPLRQVGQGKYVKPLVTLVHDEEITCVAGTDESMEVYTCTDDNRIHKWSLLGRSLEPKNPSPANPVVRTAKIYKSEDIELEEIVCRHNSTQNDSPSTAVKTSPSTPLISMTGWLNKSATPLSRTPPTKRPLKEDTTPTSTRVSTEMTTPEPKAKRQATPSSCKASKKKKQTTPPANKITDYFR